MPDRYEPSSFEAKWRERWKAADLFATRQDPQRPKFYGLDFFPYPSGAGLSVGHCRNYIPTDVICRMKYMQGYNVLHPMGFDAFGLPAENEAIKNKVHPAPMVKRYAENYKRQMELIGISYDWSRSFASSDPEYYKWTQWIFKRLFQRGLAYRKEAAVNWCPQCKTVLADEEVAGGLCWRCESIVEKRFIPQWFFKITAYAQRLLDDLNELDWPEGIKQMQRNWIGRSEGVEFEMRVEAPSNLQPGGEGLEVVSESSPLTFRVFTTRIDTIFGMTFAVLAPEHPLVDRILRIVPQDRREAIEGYRSEVKRLSDQDRLATTHEKTGVFTGLHAINPATGQPVPLWIADYVLYGYGTGAIMAVPAHDERDFEFAQKFGIPIRRVIAPRDGSEVPLPWVDKDGIMVDSGEYSGMTVAEGQRALGEWIEASGIGSRKIQYRLRDWLISRQRYWGCPIPIVHDSAGNMETVPDDQLPVLLPDVEHYEPTGDGTSPLAHIEEFVNCTDSEGRLARRETDTMGGFACSSWYFLRFCDPHNARQPWSPEAVRYWMPVDCYVGGAEHAVMHLLYARFWTKFLYDEGLVPVKEPFQRLQNQGMVLAQTPFRHPRSNERLEVGQPGIQITFEEAARLPADQVFYRWEKMSKSKGNVVTPDEAVERHGADALRVYELFVAPFDQAIQWTDEGLQGAARFLSRVFRLASEVAPWWRFDWEDAVSGELTAPARTLRRKTHQTIRKAGEDIERFSFNTYIAALMTFVNQFNEFLREVGPDPSESERAVACEALQSLILLLSPAAPHTADEIWEMLGGGGFTYQMDWPSYSEELCREERLTIAVQVNGKLRDTVEVEADASQEEVERLAQASSKVQTHLAGKTIRKIVYVPQKLVNIVVT